VGEPKALVVVVVVVVLPGEGYPEEPLAVGADGFGGAGAGHRFARLL